jgi:phosphonate transport system ATP-binding protein
MQLQLVSASARHPAAAAHAQPALRSLGLALAAGEQVAVIGPSGAGKTTLLQLLGCALRPVAGTNGSSGAAGQVLLDGRDPWALPRAQLQGLRRQLFIAPQVPPLPPRQRVVTAVLAGQLPAMGLWRSLRSLFYPVDIPAAEAALARFDLADKLFERVDRLSGGERQRVGLARALVADARLWLVDEPLSALDPARAQQAMLALTQAARARGTTLVASLHHVDMALAHFPRILGLRSGEIVFDLPSAQVTPERLRSLYAQHLDELHVPVHVSEPMAAVTPPVMHCR